MFLIFLYIFPSTHSTEQYVILDIQNVLLNHHNIPLCSRHRDSCWFIFPTWTFGKFEVEIFSMRTPSRISNPRCQIAYLEPRHPEDILRRKRVRKNFKLKFCLLNDKKIWPKLRSRFNNEANDLSVKTGSFSNTVLLWRWMKT